MPQTTRDQEYEMQFAEFTATLESPMHAPDGTVPPAVAEYLCESVLQAPFSSDGFGLTDRVDGAMIVLYIDEDVFCAEDVVGGLAALGHKVRSYHVRNVSANQVAQPSTKRAGVQNA